MLRHAEMIRLSIMLLERVGYDVSAAGGPGYCCGTTLDHQPHPASNMASRTVARFNQAAEQQERRTVVTWCPSCHMHMSDIMAPGNTTAFDIAHITELLSARRRPTCSVAHRPGEAARPVTPACRVRHACPNQREGRWPAARDSGPGARRWTGPAPAICAVPLRRYRERWRKQSHATWAAALAERCDTVCTIFHSCHRELVALDGTDDICVRNWVQLLAEAMGVPASDAYLGWRKGGAPDIAAIEKAGPSRYQALVEPELRKPSPLDGGPGGRVR